MKVLRSHTNKSHMEKDFPTWISQLRTQPKSNQTIILLVYKPNPFNCSGLILQCLLWVSPLNHNSCNQGNRIAIATHYHFCNICTLLVDTPLLKIINHWFLFQFLLIIAYHLVISATLLPLAFPRIFVLFHSSCSKGPQTICSVPNWLQEKLNLQPLIYEAVTQSLGSSVWDAVDEGRG